MKSFKGVKPARNIPTYIIYIEKYEMEIKDWKINLMHVSHKRNKNKL